MSDKDREAWYVERLRSLWSDFPVGPRTPSENPDFLVHTSDGIVGVEVTEFASPPQDREQHIRELVSVQDQIVARARERYQEAGGPVLIVDIEFDGQVRLSKADMQPTADAIATRLLSHTFALDAEIGWHQDVPGPMPHGVSALSGGRYRFAESWDGGNGLLMRDCTVESVQTVINKKAERYQAYRTQCNTVILVIVFSSEHDPRTDVPFAVLEHDYTSPFARTVALLADIPEAFVLRTVALVA
jgi:hypothetical protein